MSDRLAKLPSWQRKDRFVKEDFCRGGKLRNSGDEEDLFSDLVGCEDIIVKLKEYQDTIAFAKSIGRDPKSFIEFNFLFVGSPGKTLFEIQMIPNIYIIINIVYCIV